VLPRWLLGELGTVASWGRSPAIPETMNAVSFIGPAFDRSCSTPVIPIIQSKTPTGPREQPRCRNGLGRANGLEMFGRKAFLNTKAVEEKNITDEK